MVIGFEMLLFFWNFKPSYSLGSKYIPVCLCDCHVRDALLFVGAFALVEVLSGSSRGKSKRQTGQVLFYSSHGLRQSGW